MIVNLEKAAKNLIQAGFSEEYVQADLWARRGHFRKHDTVSIDEIKQAVTKAQVECADEDREDTYRRNYYRA